MWREELKQRRLFECALVLVGVVVGRHSRQGDSWAIGWGWPTGNMNQKPRIETSKQGEYIS